MGWRGGAPHPHEGQAGTSIFTGIGWMGLNGGAPHPHDGQMVGGNWGRLNGVFEMATGLPICTAKTGADDKNKK